MHLADLHKDSNVVMVNTRRKRQILTCIWRNISKGVIDITLPVRETRQNDAPYIYTCLYIERKPLESQYITKGQLFGTHYLVRQGYVKILIISRPICIK